MDEIGRTERYLFVLALALMILAYWAGANKLLGTLFAGANALDLTATGRDQQGHFAAYPSGGPTG